MINIIIADDHRLFRMSLQMALSGCDDICVSGEAETGAALFALLDTTLSAEEKELQNAQQEKQSERAGISK